MKNSIFNLPHPLGSSRGSNDQSSYLAGASKTRHHSVPLDLIAGVTCLPFNHRGCAAQALSFPVLASWCPKLSSLGLAPELDGVRPVPSLSKGGTLGSLGNPWRYPLSTTTIATFSFGAPASQEQKSNMSFIILILDACQTSHVSQQVLYL